MKILDGKVARDKIAEDLRSKILNLRSKPKLVIVQVGDLAESNAYIRQKVLFGKKIGAVVQHKRFDADISQKALIDELLTMNHEPSTHGIIIQQPIPKHLDKNRIIDSIDPLKDVDGQTSTNIKLLFEDSHSISSTSFPPPAPMSIPPPMSFPRKRESSAGFSIKSRMTEKGTGDHFQGVVPATTKGVLTLLDYYKIPISSKHIVIVGRSSLVGKPTALAFLNRDATVTICHSKTSHLSLITRTCDILVVAAGKPNLITKEHVSKNQVVIDVGINVVNQLPVTRDPLREASQKPENEPSRKIVGDVDFENVSKIVKAISPVPGGVGPMTVASLFQNLLEAYKRQT